MKITCLGAARTVTGSSFLVEKDPECRFLVDCGMFQGGRQIETRNWQERPYRPRSLKAIFITHAHIDHSGLVPRLVKLGYRGPIYATQATCELLKILWLDSAHIQEMEAQWQTTKNLRTGRPEVEPLYETPDAQAAGKLLAPVDLDTEKEFLPGVKSLFVSAGHILGAASLHLTVESAEGKRSVGFSGDLGRPSQLIVPDPEHFPVPQAVFMETTYGSRRHKTLKDSQAELIKVIKTARAEGGKVLIPAFAVERTQEIIYTLAAAYRRGELPDDMPVFLDSPLAIAATEIFRAHPEFFDDDTKAILENGDRPLNFPNLKFTPSTEESRAINNYKGPAVIMAGNGMASAGRIKHHLKHNLWRPNTHVVIVGFQAQGTTGRLLVEGKKRVKVFREDVEVKAHVHTIGGFSAHADQGELLSWLEGLAHPGLKVFLIHGEEESSLAFQKIAKERFPELSFHIPEWKEVIDLMTLEPAAVQAHVRAGRKEPGVVNLEHRLAVLRTKLLGKTGLAPEVMAALEKSLADAEAALG